MSDGSQHPSIQRSMMAVATASAVAATAGALGTASSAAKVLSAAGAAAAIANQSTARSRHSAMLVAVWGQSLADVEIKPYSAITWNKDLASFTFGAWTNSGKTIYMKDHTQFGFDDTVHHIVLYHEGWHIKQFRAAGGRPKTYLEMMRHEREAYPQSVKWLRTKAASFGVSRTDINLHIKVYSRLATGIAAELKATAGLSKDLREKTLKEFMLGGGRNKLGLADDGKTPIPDPLLPPHKNFKDLYGY